MKDLKNKQTNKKSRRDQQEIERMQRSVGTTTTTDLNDPDNQVTVIIHTEPTILECEVKWALQQCHQRS